MSFESSNEKMEKKQSPRSFHRQLVIVFTFLVFFGTALIIAPKDSGVVEEYIRRSSNDQSDVSVIEKMKAFPKLKLSELQSFIADAKNEISESEEEALAKTEEDLSETLSEVEKTLKKALEHLLSRNGYSSKQEKEVEDQVIKKLESKVKEFIESEVSVINEDAMEDIDETLKIDMNVGLDVDEIQYDVVALRDYLTKGAQNEVDYAGKIIRDNIRGIVESIEKEVISDKLGIEVTEDELEDSELHSKVITAAEELAKKEDIELKKSKDEMSVDFQKTNDQIKVILEDSLVKKGLALSEVKYISKEVSDRLKEILEKNFKYFAEDVKDEVDEVAQLELDNIIQEDKMVIEKAKELGMQANYNEDNSEVDVISEDIKDLSKDLDEYLKETVTLAMKDLKSRLINIVGQIEEEVLEENGVKMTESELQDLVTTSN